MLRIQRHQVGLPPHGQTTNGAASGLRPALHGLQGHGRGHLGLRGGGQHIALAQRKALAIFEHQQLLSRIHAGMAV